MSDNNKQMIRQNIIDRLELYRHDDWQPVAYTQTFKNNSLMNMPFDTQHEYKHRDIIHALQEVVNFVVVPEATVEGNVHYHGIIISIKKKKKRKWYNEALPSLKAMGFIKIKKITDMSRWIDYMLKDFEDFSYMITNKSYQNNYLIHNYNDTTKQTQENIQQVTPDYQDDDSEIIFHCVRVKKVKKANK